MRADNVIEGCAGVCEGLAGDLEDASRLARGVQRFGAYRTGSGNMNRVAHAHGAREADDRLKGRSAADVLAHGFHCLSASISLFISALVLVRS
jgi:hypothetical protein